MKRALLLVFAACSGGSGTGADIEGMWQVTRAAANETACEPDANADNFPPYVLFHRESFSGRTTIAYDACPDATGVGCLPLTGLVHGFDEPIVDGWRAVSSGSSGDPGRCDLDFDERTAVIDDEIVTGIVIEHHAYHLNGSVAACSVDEAVRLGSDMPCVGHDVVEATRL